MATTYVKSWVSTSMQRQFSRERTDFLRNGAGTIGYPHAKNEL